MNIKPFIALRPPPDRAAQIAAPPYDVVDTHEARMIARDNPMCFLRISRSEIDFPEDTDPHADVVYEQAAANLESFIRKGYLAPAPKEAVYVYRLEAGNHAQTGLVTVCHVEEYERDIIRKHEKTRKRTEDDRARHVFTLNANTGPVFLTYRDQPAIDRLTEKVAQGTPLYQFTSDDGVRHTVWESDIAEPFVEAFSGVPAAYVADGHHRAASAVRVAQMKRENNPQHTGRENYNWFLSVLFPAGQLRILPYNRCVRDLNGLSPAAFLERVGKSFSVQEGAEPEPDAPGRVSFYLEGTWYGLRWSEEASADDPVASLDVSILQDRLLDPILGIRDPRNDPRIEFIGGIRGVNALTQRVDRGRAAVAFSMYPVRVEQLMEVADAGLIMPPKSTWFEPKLRSGLLVHRLD